MTPREMIEEFGADSEEEVLTADGFDDALVGLVEGWHLTGERFIVALYDRQKCIDVLMDRDDMTWDDAVDFFEVNVVGGYHGPGTPCFASFPDTD